MVPILCVSIPVAVTIISVKTGGVNYMVSMAAMSFLLLYHPINFDVTLFGYTPYRNKIMEVAKKIIFWQWKEKVGQGLFFKRAKASE